MHITICLQFDIFYRHSGSLWPPVSAYNLLIWSNCEAGKFTYCVFCVQRQLAEAKQEVERERTKTTCTVEQLTTAQEHITHLKEEVCISQLICPLFYKIMHETFVLRSVVVSIDPDIQTLVAVEMWATRPVWFLETVVSCCSSSSYHHRHACFVLYVTSGCHKD